MHLQALPLHGLPFLETKDGNILMRRGMRNHFELLQQLTGDTPIEAWLRVQQPCFGRVGVRGGEATLLTLTKPVSNLVLSEQAEQELDLGVQTATLRRVLVALRDL